MTKFITYFLLHKKINIGFLIIQYKRDLMNLEILKIASDTSNTKDIKFTHTAKSKNLYVEIIY